MNVKQYIDMMLTIMYFDNEWEFRAVADQALVATKFVFENHDTDGAMTKTIGDITPFNYDQKWQITDPAYSEIFKGPGGIFGNLYNATTRNLEFKTMVRDRVYEAFQKPNGALTPNRIITKLNELRTGVRPAWNMEWARFNQTFYNNYDQEFADNLPNVPDRFQYNLDKWLERGLKHTLLPVVFSQPNGTVTTPVLVTNPSNKGVVYYMLDGTDPMGNDGVIKPTAKLYTNQLSLNVGVNNVVARVYFNAEWGPKATATYTSAVAVLAAQVSRIFSANARLDGQKAVVSWISKTSVAADYFTVEKRNALGVFETMKTVNAQGVSQPDVLENYSWTDENLVEGDNIYRVGLTSTALKTSQSRGVGIQEYSEQIKVKFIPADIYSIFPNPTAQFFDVDLSSVEGKMVSISVFNTMGVAVLNKKIEKAARTERIHIENLTPAQYQVVIQPQGKRVVMKKVSVVRM
jgi:Secretion system C-terminal sorting domain